MHDYVGQKFKRHLPLQFLITGQPDDAHSTAPEHFDQRITAEKFLPADILAQRRIQSGAGHVITHLTRLMTGKTEIKRKPNSDVIPNSDYHYRSRFDH